MDFFAEEMMDLKPAAVPGKKQITMQQKIMKIQHFYRSRKEQEEAEQTETEQEPVEENIAQLVFHFTRNRIRIVEERPVDYALVFAERRKSQLEILMYHEEQELQDYLKYMAVPMKRGTEDPILRKEQLAQQVVNELRIHPEYLSILFSKKILMEFLESVKVWSTDQVKLSNEAVVKLCSWGLLDMEVRKKKGWTRAYFAFAGDVDSLEEYYRNCDLVQLYRRKEQIMQLITGLVKSYGILDLDTLYEKYTDLAVESIDKEVWKRYIYLSGTFNSLFLTGEDSQNQNQYVIMQGISIDRALQRMAKWEGAVEYGDFTKKQILGWKHGVTGFSADFQKLKNIMKNTGLREEQEEKLQQMLNRLYGLVMQGESLKELNRFWRENWMEEIAQPDLLWEDVLHEIYQKTAIIPLLAHNRNTVENARK